MRGKHQSQTCEKASANWLTHTWFPKRRPGNGGPTGLAESLLLTLSYLPVSRDTWKITFTARSPPPLPPSGLETLRSDSSFATLVSSSPLRLCQSIVLLEMDKIVSLPIARKPRCHRRRRSLFSRPYPSRVWTAILWGRHLFSFAVRKTTVSGLPPAVAIPAMGVGRTCCFLICMWPKTAF